MTAFVYAIAVASQVAVLLLSRTSFSCSVSFVVLPFVVFFLRLCRVLVVDDDRLSRRLDLSTVRT